MEQLIKKLFLMPQLGLKSSRIFIFSTEMLISFELMHKIIHFSRQSNKSQHAHWNYHRADLNSNLMTVINVVTEISSELENKKPGNWAGESCHDDKNKNLLTILIKTWKKMRDNHALASLPHNLKVLSATWLDDKLRSRSKIPHAFPSWKWVLFLSNSVCRMP